MRVLSQITTRNLKPFERSTIDMFLSLLTMYIEGPRVLQGTGWHIWVRGPTRQGRAQVLHLR